MALAAVAPLKTADVTAPAVTARVIDNYDDFLALESTWTELVGRSSITHPFLEHCWVRTWWECFGRGSRLHVVVVSEGAKAIAIAPLIVSKTSIFGITARRLGFFYNSHVPRGGFIVAEGARKAYEVIWKTIRRSAAWDFIQLCQLTEDSEALQYIRELAHHDVLPAGLWKSGASPRVHLNRTWDEYHQTLPSKHRSNLRNRFKRLEQAGPVELDTVTGGGRREDALREGFALESAAWKGANGTAILNNESVARFYELFSKRAAEHGWLRLNFLRAAGRPVAFDYSLEYGGRIFLLKLGYDPCFSPYSPSNLLLGTTLKEAFSKGLSEYDFLGEEAEWKRCWTTDTQSNFWFYVFAPSVRGRLLHRAKFEVIPALKRNRSLNRLAGVMAGVCAGIRTIHDRTHH